jgi:hypothetical protein
LRLRWVLLWLLIAGVLLAVEVGLVLGLITPGSFLGFIFAITIISVLSIVGAVFVGMFVSHRILSTAGFTPFEQEMLRMRQDLHELTEKVAEIAARLGVTIGNPNNPKPPP